MVALFGGWGYGGDVADNPGYVDTGIPLDEIRAKRQLFQQKEAEAANKALYDDFQKSAAEAAKKEAEAAKAAADAAEWDRRNAEQQKLFERNRAYEDEIRDSEKRQLFARQDREEAERKSAMLDQADKLRAGINPGTRAGYANEGGLGTGYDPSKPDLTPPHAPKAVLDAIIKLGGNYDGGVMADEDIQSANEKWAMQQDRQQQQTEQAKIKAAEKSVEDLKKASEDAAKKEEERQKKRQGEVFSTKEKLASARYKMGAEEDNKLKAEHGKVVEVLQDRHDEATGRADFVYNLKKDTTLPTKERELLSYLVKDAPEDTVEQRRDKANRIFLTLENNHVTKHGLSTKMKDYLRYLSGE